MWPTSEMTGMQSNVHRGPHITSAWAAVCCCLHSQRGALYTSCSVTSVTATWQQTSVSETIRKPPLVKAQTALRKQKNKIWRKTIFNMADGILTPCNVARRGTGIMTLNSPGGSTLQCGRWLWDDIPLNSPKCPPYWNSTSGLDFDHRPYHRSRHVILHQSAKFYRNWTTIGRKK